MRPAPDCILLVRGGGSYEDLMTFNDEALARAVASCPVPVVTGIGHEPDTSICDMVSDRRCSTPTAAAESVAPAISNLANLLSSRASSRARGVIEGRGRSRADEALDGRISNPWSRGSRGSAPRSTRRIAPSLKRLKLSWSAGAQSSRRPPTVCLRAHRASRCAAMRLRSHSERLVNQGRSLLRARSAELASSAASLEALSPLKVLARGYAIAYGESGVATSAASFEPDAPVRVRMADGDVYGSVTKVEMLDARASRHE